MKKYVVHSGFIISETDGDRHYVTGMKVAKLVGLKQSECIFLVKHHDSLGRDFKQMIHVYPQTKYEDYQKLKKELA